MDVLAKYLEDQVRPKVGYPDVALLHWLGPKMAPEVRLAKFDTWLRIKLAERLDWSWAGTQKAKRIEQARIYVERMVLELWRRGWLLDGRYLAARILIMLDTIAAYQKAGKVQSFWPYFCACVERYVGTNAEELKDEAMRVGSTMSLLLGKLMVTGAARPATLPELLAARAGEVAQAKVVTLREKQARERARQAACKADAQQPRLL